MKTLTVILLLICLSPLATVQTAPPVPVQATVDTTYRTPTGRIVDVKAGANLQAALDAAQPGDALVLQAGGIWTGTFYLKPKVGTGVIFIISSAAGSLPVGVRVLPTQASLLPKILSNSNRGAIETQGNASNWRLVGLEISLAPSVTVTNTGLVRLGGGDETSLAALPSNIVIDRCYIHGSATQETTRGIGLNSASSAVIDSWISDIHSSGADSQAICGWAGPGPYKIVNNYLEAAGENVMWGGSDARIANLVPSDIEFRRNHLYKPLTWNVYDKVNFKSPFGQAITWQATPSPEPGEDPRRLVSPRYVDSTGRTAKHWVVKNLYESKNSQRVLMEGNLLENSWADGQVGFGILIKSVNQGGTNPWAVSADYEIRNNRVKNVAAGINLLGKPSDQPGLTARRIRITNMLLEIDGLRLNSSGALLQISDVPDVTIDHVTAIHTGQIIIAYGPPSPGFIFTNSIAQRNGLGVKGDGTGEGITTLNAFMPGAVFTRNLIAGTTSAVYPAGNAFVPDIASVGFVDPTNGNFRLRDASRLGTDGKVIGADIDAIEAAMRGGIVPPPVPNPAPTATLTPTVLSGVAPLTVLFTGTGTDTAPGSIVRYALDFGDGASVPQASASHTYSVPGTYTAKLTVFDNGGASATATAVITVLAASAKTLTQIIEVYNDGSLIVKRP